MQFRKKQILLIIFFFFFICNGLFAQLSQKIDIRLEKGTIKSFFTAIESKTDYTFMYNNLELTTPVTITAKQIELSTVLEHVLSPLNIEYEVSGKRIILKKAKGLSENNKTVIVGTVTDERGEPIIGANLVEKGTTNGTITDYNGQFSISVAKNAVLQVSYIGYIAQELALKNKKSINIVLKEDLKMLEEVVVVSYGTQKKRDMTGSISSVKADALSDLPVGQIGQKLQGQVAGVQINQSTGIPGQGMAFRIRGAVSINNSSQPLIVVDGFPISTGLNNINPDEIESFSVLKDAAATALYGSRAGNGVILITTKRGKQGKLNVQVQANLGVQTLNGLNDMDVMNAREFAQFKKESFEDAIKWGKREESLGVPTQYQNPNQYGEGTDWYKLMTQNALIQNYSINFAGGNKAATTSNTIGYFKQDGVVKNSGFERISFRSNNDFQLNDRVKIGLSVSPILQLFHNQGTDGNRAILSASMLADPTESPYDENGNLKISLSPSSSGTGMFSQVNWVRAITERKDNYNILTLLANAFIDIDIWGGIKYKMQTGIDTEWRKQRTWTPSTAAGDWISAPPGKASANYNNANYYTWNVENMLTFDKTFGNHTVGALIGYSAQKYRREFANISGSEFPDDEIEWITSALTTRQGNTGMEDWTIASLLARISYKFKDKYLLQANIRRDGSSRFGSGHKWANFPSASAGWIISEEPFMESSRELMNYLKLRVSYGITGNYNIGNYTHLATVASANYPFGGEVSPGKTLTQIGNQKLSWEENSQFDIGVDFGFLNDRIFLMYDFYTKKTKSLLNNLEIPWTSGFSSVMSNMGKIKSWGHEISIESRNLVGEFQWKTNLNLTFNRNKVLQLSAMSDHIGGDSEFYNWNRLEVGQPVGIFMGYVFDGVYMNKSEFDSQPKHSTSQIGSVRMKDISGPTGVPDGIIDP